MIRFIDLYGVGTGANFAWLSTISDNFLDFNGQQTFDSWSDFESFYEEPKHGPIDRYKSLVPAWALSESDCLARLQCSHDEFWSLSRDRSDRHFDPPYSAPEVLHVCGGSYCEQGSWVSLCDVSEVEFDGMLEQLCEEWKSRWRRRNRGKHAMSG